MKRPLLRTVFSASVLAISFAAFSVPSRDAFAADAQVSDSERAAARQLYTEGDELQRAGKFSEALDKFQRAQKLFSAPTNLVRAAQCYVALGRLVEASETYRQVTRTQLPDGSPAAFVAAQQQAATEGALVDPRIPKLRIDVTPPEAQNPSLQIDGRTYNAALIGTDIPLDPGTHKISIFSPGFQAAEQTITLKERAKTSVSFELKRVLGGPKYDQPIPGPSETDPTRQDPPPVDKPVPIPAPQAPPVVKTSSVGYLVGANFGAMLPGGNLETGAAVGDYAKAGGAFGLDAGVRFARSFFVLGAFQYSVLGGGKGSSVVTGHFDDGSTTSNSASTWHLSAQLGWVPSPDRFSVYGELGVGYRSFTSTEHADSIVGRGSIESRQSRSGPDFNIGGGLWIPAGNSLRIVPKINVGFGSYTNSNSEIETCGPLGACTTDSTSTSIASSGGSTHTFVFLGVGGYYSGP